MNQEDKRCGQCKWHHDSLGLAGPNDPKNCFAAPSDMVLALWFTPTAPCSFPEKFERRGKAPQKKALDKLDAPSYNHNCGN